MAKSTEWLFDIDEATRRYVRRILSDLSEALAQPEPGAWNTGKHATLTCEIPYAIRLERQRRPAILELHQGLFNLWASSEGSPAVAWPLHILGPVIAEDPDADPTDLARSTTLAWLDGLKTPVSVANREAFNAHRDEVAMFILGLAAASPLDWRDLYLSLGADGKHWLHISPADHSPVIFHKTSPDSDTDLVLSPALRAILDRFAESVTVTTFLMAEDKPERPWISIGPLWDLTVENNHNPIQHLKAVSALKT